MLALSAKQVLYELHPKFLSFNHLYLHINIWICKNVPTLSTLGNPDCLVKNSAIVLSYSKKNCTEVSTFWGIFYLCLYLINGYVLHNKDFQVWSTSYIDVFSLVQHNDNVHLSLQNSFSFFSFEDLTYFFTTFTETCFSCCQSLLE